MIQLVFDAPRRRRRWARRLSSSATRSTRAPRARPGTTRSSRGVANTRSSTRARVRTPTSSSSRCIWGTVRRPGSGVTTRAGRPATSKHRSCCCRQKQAARTTRSPGSDTTATGGRRFRGRTAGRPDPTFKDQWAEPITWVDEEWRSDSVEIPASDSVAPTATGFFCTAVEKGSEIYIRFLRNPFVVLGILAAIVMLAIWLSRRTNWSPALPHPIRQRRDVGEIYRSGFVCTGAVAGSSSGSG